MMMNLRSLCPAGAIYAFWFLLVAPFVHGEAYVEVLPTMTQASNWSVSADAQGSVTLSQQPGRLGLSVSAFPRDAIADILLNTPIDVPDWSDSFSMDVHSLGGWGLGVNTYLLIEDARGYTYRYKLQSPLLPNSTQFFPNNKRPASIRLQAPGFKRPVLYRQSGHNIMALEDGNRSLPEAPLTLYGVRLEGVNYAPDPENKAKPVLITLGNFEFTHLNWREAEFYYSLAGNALFGVVDPVPTLLLGDLGQPFYGEQFLISWDVRDTYDGQPFLSGGESIVVDRDSEDYSNVFLKGIEIPVFEEGTYWVRVKKKWSRVPSGIPERINELDIRLDILKGKAPASREALAADEPIPNSFIRMVPDWKTLTVDAGKSVTWNATFWKPQSSKANAYSWHLTLRQDNSGALVQKFEGTLGFEESMENISVDLGVPDAGAYQVCMELFQDNKILDQSTSLLGVRQNDETVAAIPDSVASYQEILDGPSIIYLMPHGHEHFNDPEERWELLKNFLDQAAEITSTVEFIVRWRDIEPMPGVFDFSELDRFLDYAQQKGITVLIWPSLVGAEPEWLPALYEEPRNEDGEIFNPIPYTFHGGRINHYYADTIKEATKNVYATLAKRYRGNPAVHGYFVLTEHPYDMPSSGWYIGGSEESLDKYREHLREKYKSLSALNAYWFSEYPSWDVIGIPPESASDRQRLDWLSFLRRGVGDYLVECVETIREIDDHRIIQVYTGGMTPESLEVISTMGCMMADGGSQNPETFGGAAMGIAEYGLHRRAEEVSVGNWSAHFPTQLDATLYTMLLGGGGNANIKMFYPVRSDYDDLLPAPHSLGRFLEFIPVWKELRGTKTMPREVYMLNDLNGGMLELGRLNYHGELWPDMVLMDAGINAPWVGIEKAKQAKLMMLPGITYYEEAVINELVAYVSQGGTLFMYADSGRYSPDRPEEDWVLLRQFGLKPPPVEEDNSAYVNVEPVIGEVFGEGAGAWRMRNIWPHALQDREMEIASIEGDVNRPAITVMPFGKGEVVVAWASTIVPSVYENEYPFMRDIAAWAGVSLPAGSSSPSLWTNLVYKDNGEDFYGLVYHPSYLIRNKQAVEGEVFWSLPSGEYHVTEMISGRDLGQMTSEALKAQGIPTALAPREVAIYHMQKAKEHNES